MNIIIMGGGKVGGILCRQLSSIENCDVTVIEKNEEVLNRLTSKFDIYGIVGSGTDVEIVKQTPIEDADIFVAVSEKDEANLISSIIAKKLGAKYTISRVRGTEYSGNLGFLREAMGISLVINPEKEAAYSVYRMIKYPYAVSVETFVGLDVSIIGVYIDENSIVKNTLLKDFRKRFNIIICVIQRDSEVFIPDGNSKIHEGDIVYVTGQPKDMQLFYQSVGFLNEKPLKKAMIIGGGRMNHYLLPLLKRLNMDITVVEINRDMARDISSTFEDVTVINRDGTDQDLLDELVIESYDTFISLTGVDEENALASLYAYEKGVKKIITKINRTAITRLFDKDKLKSIVNPKRIIADEIIRTVRSQMSAIDSDLLGLYTLADEQVEAMQFQVAGNSKFLGKKLIDLQFIENTLVAYIIRDGRLFFPTGMGDIRENDLVLIVTKNDEIIDIDDILV